MTRSRFLPIAVCTVALGACGKKGPPLAPIAVLPTPAIDLKVDQRESAALLTFTAPTRTTTGVPLERIEAVEIYRFTEPVVVPAAQGQAAPALALGATSGSQVKTAAQGQAAPETQGQAPPGAQGQAPPALATPSTQSAPALAFGATSGSQVKTAGQAAPGAQGQAAPALATQSTQTSPAAERAPKVRAVEATEFEARASKSSTLEGADLEAATLGGKIQVGDPIPAEDLKQPSWHYYAVRTRDPRGKVSTWSNIVGLLVRESLPAPADLGSAVTAKAIQLNWSAAPGAAGYRLYRAEADGPFGIEPIHPATLSDTAFQDATFKFGGRYRYRVFACRSASPPYYESAASNSAAAEPRDIFPPALPTGLSVIARSSSVVELFWEPNREADLAGYAVYRRPAGGSDTDWKLISPASGLRGESFRDTDVQSGAAYEYAVAALDDSEPPNQSKRSEPARQLVP